MQPRRKTWLSAPILTSLAVFAFSTVAQADPRDDVIAALAKCTDVPDRLARFDCYEKLGPQARAVAQPPPSMPQPTTAPSPPPAAVVAAPASAAPVSTAPENAAPQSAVNQPMGGEILPMTSVVDTYTIASSGAFTVTLENGQIWREHDRDFDTPSFSRNKKDIVVIQRGLLGGYDLHIKGTSKFFKVVRVK